MRVRTRLLLHWAAIAAEHLDGAEQARAELVRQKEAAEPQEAMATELRESMICVAACAHAIDALFGELVAMAEGGSLVVTPEQRAIWKANGTPRHSQIFETFKGPFAFARKHMRNSSGFSSECGIPQYTPAPASKSRHRIPLVSRPRRPLSCSRSSRRGEQ